MLRIGLFGAGHLGRIHLQQWKEVPGARVAGFFDPDDAAAEAAQAATGIPRFSSPESLLAACDAVDIVTPTVHHHAVAMEAIAAGKHLFIEKPIAQTLAEGREIAGAAAGAGLACAVGHVERYNPALAALGESAPAPLFIEAHRLAQFNARGTDVAVVLDLMIHDIDIVLHLVRSPVRSVSASGVGVVSDTADIANARIEFENGCVANLTASRISLKKLRKMRLFGRDAYIGLDFLEKKTEVVRLGEKAAPEAAFSLPLQAPDGGEKVISVQWPAVPSTNAIRAELTDFVEAIAARRPPRVTAEAGCAALEVAGLILDEMARRGPLPPGNS